MASRQPRRPLYPQAVTRPTARPVDTYVRPAETEASKLATALAEVSPSVQRFSTLLSRRIAEEERAKGEAAARELMEAGKTYAEAIRENLIDPHASPFYIASLKEQSGRIAADKWEHQLTIDIGQSNELKNALDLEAFDRFVNEHRRKWLAENVGDGRDAHFEKGFGARADAYYMRARDKFANGLASRVRKVSTDQHFAEVRRMTRDSLLHGATPEQVAGDITQLLIGVAARGENPKDFYKATIEAVASAAEEQGDDRWLAVLQHLKDEAGHAFSDLPAGAEIIDQTRTRIWDNQVKRSEYEHKVRERREQERIDKTLARAAKEMADNPDTPIDLKRYVVELGGDQRAIERLKSLADSMDEIDVRTDQEVYKELLVKFYEPVDGNPLTARDVISARADKRLSNKHMKEFLAMIEDRDNKRARGEGLEAVLENPALKEALRGITAERFSTGLTNFAGGSTQDKAAAARVTLIHDFITNLQHVSKLPPAEQFKWANARAAAAVQEQRRGKTPGINEEPATPVYVGEVPNDRLVLTEDQMKRIALGDEKALLELKVFADKYGLVDHEVQKWFLNQVKLFKTKHGRKPGDSFKKKEE